MPSTTAYAKIITSDGGTLRWFAQSSAGIHETLNGWIGQYVLQNVEPLVGSGLVQYDNAPPIGPGESVHAVCEVRFADTEHVGGYAENHYRKTGSVDFTLRGPVAQGDDALLELAESIRAVMQGIDVPVDVHFRAPSAPNLGRDGGWYEVGLSCPWWYDEFAARTATSGASVNGDFADVASVVRGRFKSLVADAESIPTAYDDAPPANAAGGIWARWTVRNVSAIRSETPAAYRTINLATAQVFAPTATGTGALYQVADTIYESFRACAQDGVVFQVPNVRTVGRGADWWQVNVDCPFTAYQHAA